MEGMLVELDLSAHWWWLAAGLVLVFLELSTGTLFLLWPGVSALIFAAVVAFYPDMSLAAQLTLFAALAVVLTLVGRSYFKLRPITGASDKPLLNRRGAQLVGRRVSAVGPFTNGYGAVRVDDGQWSARLEQGDGAGVSGGSAMVIRAVEGSTLVVAPAD